MRLIKLRDYFFHLNPPQRKQTGLKRPLVLIQRGSHYFINTRLKFQLYRIEDVHMNPTGLTIIPVSEGVSKNERCRKYDLISVSLLPGT